MGVRRIAALVIAGLALAACNNNEVEDGPVVLPPTVSETIPSTTTTDRTTIQPTTTSKPTCLDLLEDAPDTLADEVKERFLEMCVDRGVDGLLELAPGFDPDACTFRGTRLWGKVERVEEFANPDLRVKVVTLDPDLEVVDVIGGVPRRCGEWKFDGGGFTDFTVAFVDREPDLYIKIVDVRPGPG